MEEEATAGDPPRSVSAVASTAVVDVAGHRSPGAFRWGPAWRRLRSPAPMWETPWRSEEFNPVGARGERGRPPALRQRGRIDGGRRHRRSQQPPRSISSHARPSPRAPRAPMRRPRRRRARHELRRAADPREPQSSGLLIVPGARHASLSILGGDGRRYTAHAHRPTRGARRLYARLGRPIAAADGAA